ncbi:sigma-70 family RNA polymerase sigma factor [Aliiroseovarius sp. PTFE2010]|uniref:sigma-70 family RNA polymerase sigma factor n=1 Tax=Aliiroseovarius sp. PTFE2010 TaxID=3417190 RepID=UPI003CF6EC1C
MTELANEMLQHVPSLRAYARSLTKDATRADDLVQDTLVRAMSNIEKFREGTNLRAWLFTIQRNCFYSERRKAVRETEDPDETMASQLSVPPEHDAKLQYAEFEDAFAQLSAEHREALTLIGAMGMAYEDAAETCGVPPGTMKSRTNRARKELARLMQLGEETVHSSAVVKSAV